MSFAEWEDCTGSRTSGSRIHSGKGSIVQRVSLFYVLCREIYRTGRILIGCARRVGIYGSLGK